MQAIRTRYIGPSNTKGSRIQAKCEAKTIYMSYRHELNIDGNHQAAMRQLVKAMGWNSEHYADMIGGTFDGDMYWVFDDKRLKALKGFVNSMRTATWSGNPWCKPEFIACVAAIGRSYDYHGDPLNAPTKDADIMVGE